MTKFKLKSTNTEIKIGDYFTFSSDTPIRNCSVFTKLTEEKIDYFIKNNIIEILKPEIPLDIEYYIESLAKDTGYTIQEFYTVINKLSKFSYIPIYSMLLKKIALEFNSKYTYSIQDSKDIYAISMCNGNIIKIAKEDITNYNSFAAFRTKEDTEIACEILNPLPSILSKYGK